MAFEEFAKTTAFRTVVRIITGLSVHNTRIVDELRAIHYGRISKGKIIKIDGKVPVGMRMSLARFADAVSTKLWENVARVNWRGFVEARGFARKLGLKSHMEWEAYCRSGKRPYDIPRAPESVYADAGWDGWSDWLGTRQWATLDKARAFVQRLGLNLRRNGGRTVARERGPTIFRLVPKLFMPMPGGTVGATGLEMVVLAAAIGDPSAKLAASCRGSHSNLRWNGGRTVARERGPTIFRLVPRLFMPMPGGTVGAAGLEMVVLAAAIGNPSAKLAPLRRGSHSNLPATGERTAAPAESPMTFRLIPTRCMPMPGDGWGDWLGNGNRRRRGLAPLQ